MIHFDYSYLLWLCIVAGILLVYARIEELSEENFETRRKLGKMLQIIEKRISEKSNNAEIYRKLEDIENTLRLGASGTVNSKSYASSKVENSKDDLLDTEENLNVSEDSDVQVFEDDEDIADYGKEDSSYGGFENKESEELKNSDVSGKDRDDRIVFNYKTLDEDDRKNDLLEERDLFDPDEKEERYIYSEGGRLFSIFEESKSKDDFGDKSTPWEKQN